MQSVKEPDTVVHPQGTCDQSRSDWKLPLILAIAFFAAFFFGWNLIFPLFLLFAFPGLSLPVLGFIVLLWLAARRSGWFDKMVAERHEQLERCHSMRWPLESPVLIGGLVLAVGLYLLSLGIPALKGNDEWDYWTGFWLLLLGPFAIGHTAVAMAWLANPLFVAACITLLLRRYVIATSVGALAFISALTPMAFRNPHALPISPANTTTCSTGGLLPDFDEWTVTQFAAGYYVWVGSMGLMTAVGLVMLLATRWRDATGKREEAGEKFSASDERQRTSTEPRNE